MTESSSLTINFSLRQNKAIERAIAFDALFAGRALLGEDAVYVGLGSLWFQDFQMAHRILGIRTMFSIEGDQAVYKRADFNRPFNGIEVVEGPTNIELPKLLGRADVRDRPWVTWLDYDREINEDRVDELAAIVKNVSQGSVLLATFNAKAKNYGEDSMARRQALCDLLTEEYIDPQLPDEAFDEPRLMHTLAEALLGYLQGVAVRNGRDGGFIPALRLLYRDSTYMATIGGFLPSSSRTAECQAMVSDSAWVGFEDAIIETHPLTMRELLSLSQLMPAEEPLEPSAVAALGFELSEDQLGFYARHYLRYPVYAEIR